ncbi:MAG: hypothetical protein C0408_01540 [Odoribacter sp.]|nr:hypothetical protein [Odoribacter sp.]
MKTIEVKKEIFKEPCPDIADISARLDRIGPGESIDILNWESYKYKPEARFIIACSDREIFLKYYITEEFVKAEKTESNQMVCEDSCVEFFVSPADDGIYYNFEFNAIGVCLLGAGTGRTDRYQAPVSLIERIRRMGSFGIYPFKERQGDCSWTITLAIPWEVFFLHKAEDLKGKIFRANFYKCGDKLTRPHYLTWNRVETDKPDYHRPEFFGVLKFE